MSYQSKATTAVAAALSAFVIASPAQAQTQFVDIATFSQGGNWFLVGGAVAELVNQNVEGVRVTAVPSSGVIENLQLIESGEAEIAFLHPNEAYFAANGEGRWEAPIDIKQLWNWDVPSHVTPLALRQSGLTAVDDLRGKRVSVGEPGSATLTYATDLLGLHDLTTDDISPLYYGLSETIEGLRDGTVDAAILTLTTPASALIDLTTTQDVVFLEVSDEKLDALVSSYPFYTSDELTDDVYRGIEGSQRFPAYSTVTVASSELSEELAYAITAAVFDNLEQFGRIHATAAGHSLEGAVRQQPIDLHPGAARYFRDQGILE